MERTLGTDLHDVRIHTGPESHAATLAANANALTVGKDIIFADGRYAPETAAGRRLLLHELTHVAQQRDAHGTAPDGTTQRGDPAEREATRIAQESAESVTSVHERTPLRVAADAPAATADVRAELEKTYHIKVIKGDKDWSEGDLADLSASLGKLSPKERGIVSGYELQRWTTRAKRAEVDPSYSPPPGVEECGLHELTLGGTTAKISMYDGCFDASTTMAGAPIARFNILHEVGHAAELSLARAARKTLDDAQAKSDAAYAASEQAIKDYNTANDERNDLVRQYNEADAAGKKALDPDVKKAIARATALDRAAAAAKSKAETLEKSRDAAEKAYDKAEKAPTEAFEKLVEGKDPLTDYSKDNVHEAFAEAFALYKVDPEGLKKANKKLYDWFVANGELAPPKGK